eukprot:6206408-Pleurochrysis_carterae.AAC.1
MQSLAAWRDLSLTADLSVRLGGDSRLASAGAVWGGRRSCIKLEHLKTHKPHEQITHRDASGGSRREAKAHLCLCACATLRYHEAKCARCVAQEYEGRRIVHIKTEAAVRQTCTRPSYCRNASLYSTCISLSTLHCVPRLSLASNMHATRLASEQSCRRKAKAAWIFGL